MKKEKIAIGLNFAIFVLVLFSVIWMMTGSDEGGLVARRMDVFKFFTVDSNVLMGIAALVMAIDQTMVLTGKKKEVSMFSFGLVLASTTAVTITMLVTVFYLTPLMYSALGLFGLFGKSNFFMHLFVPVLSIVTFVGFERTDRMSFRYSFVSFIPFGIYSIYYVVVTVIHMNSGTIEEGYDWYWFFHLGGFRTVIALIVVILAAYGIGFALWKIDRTKKKKQDSEGEKTNE